MIQTSSGRSCSPSKPTTESPGRADLSELEAPRLQVNYQVRLLAEAGLVAATEAETFGDRFAMLPIRLTMAGHDSTQGSRSISDAERILLFHSRGSGPGDLGGTGSGQH